MRQNSRDDYWDSTGGDFTAMFVGLGSMRVKSLFRKARKHAPCIVFIDEIDGVGRRTTTETGGASEAEGNRIINQILAEIDGFNSSGGLDAFGELHLKANTTIAVAQAESILTTQNEQCMATLRELRGALVELTGKLAERETLDGEEVAQAISNARTAGPRLTTLNLNDETLGDAGLLADLP